MNPFTAIASDAYGNWNTNTSTVNVILTNNAYAYDSDGNMTSDGYKNFAYDDENELISVWVGNAWSNSFAYDGRMRRRIERDYSWDAGTSGWVETNEAHFIYDGNLVVEERNANNIPLISYTRGNDFSGSLQGVGGIGGLLARTTYGQELPGAPTTSFYHSDGNGNIATLIYPNQQLAAKYLYDPFGNMLAMSGPLMNLNKYRFSSKEWNENSGLYYYGYRFYNANLQRWQNRDPIGELGGPNLYRFNCNNPIRGIDFLGLNGTNAPPDPDPSHYPPYDPCHPEKPSQKKVCVLFTASPPGTFHNPGGAKCWLCGYHCRPGMSGATPIYRFQVGSCQKVTGYVPGWPPGSVGQSDCETSDPGPPPIIGIPPNE